MSSRVDLLRQKFEGEKPEKDSSWNTQKKGSTFKIPASSKTAKYNVKQTRNNPAEHTPLVSWSNATRRTSEEGVCSVSFKPATASLPAPLSRNAETESYINCHNKAQINPSTNTGYLGNNKNKCAKNINKADGVPNKCIPWSGVANRKPAVSPKPQHPSRCKYPPINYKETSYPQNDGYIGRKSPIGRTFGQEDDDRSSGKTINKGRIKPMKIIPLKTGGDGAVGKDSADEWESRLIDKEPAKPHPNKSPLMAKWHKLSEGKGIVTRARKESGAPLINDKTDEGRGVESIRNSTEKMDEREDDDDDDDEYDDDDDDDDEDGDSSEDSRRNKPPVPRKPAHLAQKLNNNKIAGTTRNTTTTGIPSKPPLKAAKSTGSALNQMRVTNLSEDQRTYDQVCFEDPATFAPPLKSKNLERFFGMKPEMAEPIKSIKSCDSLSPPNRGFMRAIVRRKSDACDDPIDGNTPYAVVDLHEPERTAHKKKDRKQKNSTSNMSSAPHKADLKRVSSGAESSKLSSDSGISMVMDTSKRDSKGNSVPPALKDPLDKTGSMDSDYVEGDSTDDEPIAGDSDFDHSEDEFVLRERPTENINFINQSHKVAYEVLTSERQYVDRLHLLHKVFEYKIRSENDKHSWFPKDVINVIFSNLSTIYEFHNKFLLPQLEERMEQWENNPGLGDILVRLSPFLKLYTDYVGNFDNAIKCLNTWMNKVPKLSSLLQDIQKKPMCMSLTLQHHMLEPVQRIPRYEMLLKAYLKKLPAESSDRAGADEALGLISKAAQHSNDMMQTMDHFEKLLKLNERIDGETIIDPSRRLLKEGKITRVAARSGELLDRYLFLFNDMLLCCTQKRQLTGSISYKVKDKVDIDEVKLLDGLSTRFRLERSPKSLEFETSTNEQKEEWMAVLIEAIREMVRKKDSFKTSATSSEKEGDYTTPLGERMPVQIKDDEVTMCMRCGQEFNFKKRRHHCRACGAVVCGKCSSFTAPLAYDDNKPNRVCSRCYYHLKGEGDPMEGTRRSFVDISEHKSYSGHLWYLQPRGQTWIRYWVAATEQDLFALRAPKDVRAILTLPIKLYEAYDIEQEDSIDRDYAFKLTSKDNSYFFAADDKETKYNWLLVFQNGVTSVEPIQNGQREFFSTNL